jgi:hypothetical protein
MLPRRILVAGLALAAGLAAAPAPAAGVGASFDLARGAAATFAGRDLAADVFGFNGLSAFAPPPGLVRAREVCAAVGTPVRKVRPRPEGSGEDRADHGARELLDFGCGRAEVTVDPALRTARVRGTVPSEVVDLATFEVVGRSRITVDVTWTGTGPLRPIVSEGEQGDAQPFPPAAFFFAFAAVGSGRGAGASGSVVSAALGAVSGKTDEGFLFEGSSVSLGLFL